MFRQAAMRTRQADLASVLDDGDSLTLNLGTGTGTSVRTIVDTVGRVSGKAVPIELAPRRAGDCPRLVADPARARAVLKWHPRFEETEAIVETAWRWHQLN